MVLQIIGQIRAIDRHGDFVNVPVRGEPIKWG